MLSRLAIAFTGFAERWLPDAFVFALAATVIVFVAGLAIGTAPSDLIESWGRGFWELLGFTMQMALVIVTGYVVASARPVKRLIGWLASFPKSPRGAVAFVAAFAMLSSWVNWGFSLIFSAVLAREIARRTRGVDYRALAASSLLGLGSVWAQGLSGSAALQMATPGALPERVRAIIAHGGVVPDGRVGFEHTVFLWQSLCSVAVELVLVTLIMWLAAPSGEAARDAQSLGIPLGAPDDDALPAPSKPGEWLEHSPLLMMLIVALGGAYLARTFSTGLTSLTVNTINLTMLLLGFALHGTPARLMRAVREATPATWGVILQFPFYAGIAGMIALTRLNERIAHGFVAASSRVTFPALMAAYSAALGVFVPSGGSKWVIEAPYVMQAAHELRVHVGWVVACYDLGEALANLIQPFWMLPVLALLGLRARDVMGYTFLVFLILFPVVIALTLLLGATLPYPL
ncbi:MAG TPA: TIGR00366 family protein [Polyangia bacterium]|nr:TIGR00366 family protein [Polyangia bacterium]